MLIRLLIIVSAVPILVWTFVAEFFCGVLGAVWFAWNETLISFHQMNAAFRSKSINKEDWR
jgi:hypothetical protein